MKKVLVAYYSAGGTTAQMAQYISEGIRFSGQQADVKKMSDITSAREIEGYDGYVFGAPTYHLDAPPAVKNFMSFLSKAKMGGRLIGAFASYHHEMGYQPAGQAGDILLQTMEKDHKMKPFELGALKVKDDVLATPEGMKAGQDYGKVFGEKLGK